MRASRLLSVLLLLSNRGRMTARELADELDVSIRTIYRDVVALEEAGVPVFADRGPAGGYELVGGYRTRLTGLTGDEAQALFLAGAPAAAAELGLGAVLAAAQLKVEAALPPELRSRAGAVRERFLLDAPGWQRRPDEPPLLTAAADAVWHDREIRVRYRKWGPAEVERTLHPLALVLKSGSWYLVARAATGCDPATNGQDEHKHDNRQHGPRVYRISRILDLAVTDNRFVRQDDFDLAAFWQTYQQRYEAQLYTLDAVVRLSPRARQLLFLLGPTVVATVARTAGPPDDAGWVTATLPVESMDHAVGEIGRLGAEIEVLEPAELRERIAASVRRLAALYATGRQATERPR